MLRRLIVFIPFACALSCTESREPLGPELSIAIAPLSLSGITDACYDLRVTDHPDGAGATVWTATHICSARYGDGQGGLAYVGTCDDSSGVDNTVALTVTSLATATGPAELINPCPASAPCLQNAACVANSDTPVTFNLTIMRAANQGFFDVAVTFSDIFCSAKVDCLGSTLLTPAGDRVPTVVVALACTGGSDASTELYLGDLALECDDGVHSLAIAGPPGNVYSTSNPAPAPLRQLATYRGVEALTDSGGHPFNSLYANVAFALRLPATDACTLVGSATASDGAFVVPFTTPAMTAYPVIRIDLPIVADNASTYSCGAHPLGDGPEDGIWSEYTTLAASERFEHRVRIVSGAIAVDDRQPLALAPLTLALGPTNSATFSGSGGAAPYAYSVVSGGGSFAGAVFTAPSATANVVVRVTDSAGDHADASVTVAPLAIVPSSVTLAPSAPRTFSASGGAGGYVYSKSGVGTLVGATYTAPASPGSATVTVTDAKGNTAVAAITIAIPPVWVAATGASIFYSNDGDSWTAATIPNGAIVNVVEYASARFIGVGNSGSFVTSTDGINWTTVAGVPGIPRSTLTSGGGVFLAGGQAPVWSLNGASFASAGVGLPSNDSWAQIASDGYYAHGWQGSCSPPLGCYGEVYRASAAVGANPSGTWVTIVHYQSVPKLSGIAVPATGNFRFYGSSAGIQREDKTNGVITTIAQPTTSIASISDNRAATIVALSNGLNAFTSTDSGATWGTFATGATTPGAARVRWLGARFVGVAGASLVTSTDGMSWTVIGALPANTQAIAVKE